jgi:hypothetical protein
MLQKDLKKIANESVFNPNKPTPAEKILLDLGDRNYWVVKASEHIAYSKQITIGSDSWHNELCQAIKLLILARTSS